jgi:hypothetical protein
MHKSENARIACSTHLLFDKLQPGKCFAEGGGGPKLAPRPPITTHFSLRGVHLVKQGY